ncbi:hypothetical protein [Myroides sp. DF42-4-2]|uniref:hypothetical protein n=1 Tax=unclassified Myroides TaxID=2642485 RepID=UPI002578EF2E|nr:hypothetical protein [Myroides sp. DF42-4-2]MDM1407950.1 hypothetical protein [Myroides sp. DF42-4-2]
MMKKFILPFSFLAFSSQGFANCFTVNFSCGGDTTYCAEENSSITQITKDLRQVDEFVCE